MLLEFKDFVGEVKDIDSKGRTVTGYLSSFGNIDSDKDIMIKGAFSKSIAERKNQIFFLNQHNWNQPLSKFKVLLEDEKGLYFESEPLPDTSYGNDVIKLYEAGVLKEHSIGFQTIKADYDRETEIRNIKEVKLYEGSVVTLGANSNTPFTGLKSSLKEIEDETKLILKALRDGTFTDETFSLLEFALKQYQTQAYELGKNHSEPRKSTQEPMKEETKAILEFLNI
ncbi:MAG: HK97 family phage prohead protease [Phaeodactylibacter sp.]|nr:HK97 family phage prohead protease [Phaeodactylibacter sp.]